MFHAARATAPLPVLNEHSHKFGHAGGRSRRCRPAKRTRLGLQVRFAPRASHLLVLPLVALTQRQAAPLRRNLLGDFAKLDAHLAAQLLPPLRRVEEVARQGLLARSFLRWLTGGCLGFDGAVLSLRQLFDLVESGQSLASVLVGFHFDFLVEAVPVLACLFLVDAALAWSHALPLFRQLSRYLGAVNAWILTGHLLPVVKREPHPGAAGPLHLANFNFINIQLMVAQDC